MQFVGSIATAIMGATQGGFLAKDASPVEREFAQYLAKFGKSYLSEEEYAARLATFIETDNFVKEHNASGKSWTVGHNFMSDWTEAERKQLNGFIPKERVSKNFTPEAGFSIPSEVDWRKTLEAVRHIKDQGRCGSCWSFSTTGCVEANREKKTGKVEYLSEQQLVDCSYYNLGCNGGNVDVALDYLMQNGSESEGEYPYHAKDQKCQFERSKVVVKDVIGEYDVPSGDTAAYKKAISEGPVSIAIEADQRVFQLYTTGVIANDGSCGTQLDHAVLAVGYGSENGKDYALVKNSWGTRWGDGGFVKLQLDVDSCACGCNLQPTQCHLNDN